MSDVHDLITVIERSRAFKAFTKEFPGYRLAHIFCNVKGEGPQIDAGYYSEKDDRIVSIGSDPITVHEPEEVFKDGGTVTPLELQTVKLGLQEVRDLAAGLRESKYAAHPVLQEICVLQQIDIPVWNITLVTQTLQMIHLRFDAITGELVTEELRNILDLRKQ